MVKKIRLESTVVFPEDRVKTEFVKISDYITTDSLLQNKLGIKEALNLPPNTLSIPRYIENDILISNIRPYLKKIWFSDRNGGCSPDVLVFRVKERFEPDFIFYNLFQDEFFNHMMVGAKGTKMPRGDKDQILNFLLPDFNLEYQQKIASILRCIDEKINTNKKILDRLQKLASVIYKYWFNQYEFPDDSGLPYKSNNGKFYFNSNLNKSIPLNWKVDSLWNIADYSNGLAMQKFRPVNDDDFLPVIKIREMTEGFTYKTEKANKDLPLKAIVDNGDVLFSWSATLLVKIWTNGRAALNQHIFKVTSEKYPKSFYFFELNNYLDHFKMIANSRKTTMGHITQEHLKQALIPIPPDTLIQKLDLIINPLMEHSISIEIENLKLANYRDWLIPLLMDSSIKVK